MFFPLPLLDKTHKGQTDTHTHTFRGLILEVCSVDLGSDGGV